MPLTLQDFEDQLGKPIVLMESFDHNTHKTVVLTLEELPVTVIQLVLNYLNARLPI